MDLKNSSDIKASIDLGTNTCLLLIKKDSPSGEQILHDESTVVRLGQGVDQSGELHPDAMKRAFDCLSRYAQIAKNHAVESSSILAVGTAQARDSKNARAFFDQIKNDLGIQFRILSGDEEARATFLGAALPGLDPAKMFVMDIGGGSTELVSLESGKSLPMGAVRMTERHLKSNPVTDEEFWACEQAIDAEIEREFSSIPPGFQLVAVAGTAVTLAMLQAGMQEYDRKKLDGVILTKGDVHRWVEELKWRSLDERKALPGMEVKRADVLLAGVMIFWRVMEKLELPTAMISTRGLRYGVFKLASQG